MAQFNVTFPPAGYIDIPADARRIFVQFCDNSNTGIRVGFGANPPATFGLQTRVNGEPLITLTWELHGKLIQGPLRLFGVNGSSATGITASLPRD